MTVNLPHMPARIARLPRDERGYPVPWFVAWMKDGDVCPPGEGTPDFRVIAPKKLWTAVSKGRCWVCGIEMGVHHVYVIGPMCVINRVTSEPPCHRDCAEFAARACPFLIRPREKRNTKNMPETATVAGISIDRNPGATCLYETRKATRFKAGDGVLFRLDPPDRVDWWAKGRTATRDEVMESIDSGYPILMDMAVKEGREAVVALERQRTLALKLVPVA